MPYSIFGLPLHPLVVHATVVFVPMAALFVLGSALWPAFRRWAGPLPLAISIGALILDPISTSTGENLERQVGHNDMIEAHSRLADGLLPWVIGLTVVAAGLAWVWWRERTSDVTPNPGGAVLIAVAVLAVIAAAGTTQQVIRIGHSGAKAAWSDVNEARPDQSQSGSSS